jgi:hypothetical protein
MTSLKVKNLASLEIIPKGAFENASFSCANERWLCGNAKCAAGVGLLRDPSVVVRTPCAIASRFSTMMTMTMT